MEKYLKSLSIAFLMLTSLFFINMFGLVNAERMPVVALRIFDIGAATLLYLVPLLYMGIFGIGMVSIFKRILSAQSRMVRAQYDKFPTLWFILATLGFVIYFVFVSLVFA